MKANEYITTGQIDPEGRFKMFMDEFREFCHQHPNKRVVVKFSILSTDQSEALKAYYFKAVVPCVRNAMHQNGDVMTDSDVDKMLREISPVAIIEDLIQGDSRIKEIKDMNNSELLEHIEFVRKFAAEDLSLYISEPKN